MFYVVWNRLKLKMMPLYNLQWQKAAWQVNQYFNFYTPVSDWGVIQHTALSAIFFAFAKTLAKKTHITIQS